MKINKDDLQEFIKILDGLDELRPAIRELLAKGVDVLKELKPHIEELGDWLRARNVTAFQFYTANGMTREEALLLVIDSNASLTRAINRINTKQEGK